MKSVSVEDKILGYQVDERLNYEPERDARETDLLKRLKEALDEKIKYNPSKISTPFLQEDSNPTFKKDLQRGKKWEQEVGSVIIFKNH